MKQTFVERQKKQLLKKFHVLLGKTGKGAIYKDEMLAAYGVDSSQDLTLYDLLDVCSKLEQILNPEFEKLDKARKRLIAAIGGWLKLMNKEQSIAINKAIACRAADKDGFNEIPLERLRSLYEAFRKKQRDLKQVDEMTTEQIDIMTFLN